MQSQHEVYKASKLTIYLHKFLALPAVLVITMTSIYIFAFIYLNYAKPLHSTSTLTSGITVEVFGTEWNRAINVPFKC